MFDKIIVGKMLYIMINDVLVFKDFCVECFWFEVIVGIEKWNVFLLVFFDDMILIFVWKVR